MKKIINIAMFLILMLGLVSCGNKASISSQVESITIYENETFRLSKSYFDVKNYDGDLTFAILDKDIAYLDGLTIKPKKEGVTRIRVSISDEIYCDVNLIILSGVVANNISIEKSSVSLNLITQKVTYNKIITNEEITETPIIEYNANIIEYDYNTGKITAKSIGTTTVKIKFIRDEISFVVKVEDIVYVETLEIKDVNIKTGSSGVFDILKIPSNANAYSIWVDEKDIDIIDVTSSGHYVAKKEGRAKIHYNYKKDYASSPIVRYFQVNVISSMSETSLIVTNQNYYTCNKCFLNDEYYFVVNLPSHYSPNRIIASDNIVVSNIEYVENRGFVGTFTFKELGSQYISVTYEQDLHNPDNNITYKCIVEVVKGDNYTVRGKYSAYWVYPEGNVFTVNLTGNNDITNLKFYLDIDGVVISNGYEVYNVTNGSELLINNTFTISNSGDYYLKLIYEGVSVEFSIIVNDLRN